MTTTKPVAGRAKTRTVAERAAGHQNMAPAKHATQRPPRRPDKGAALAAYRALLRGAELPEALVSLATAADLDAARKTILAMVERLETPWSGGRWGEDSRSSQLRWWEMRQCSPEHLAKSYGVPFLELAIADRQRAEAAAAEVKERSRPLPIGDIVLSADTLRLMVDRGFLAATASSNTMAVAAAAKRSAEAARYLPPEQRQWSPKAIDLPSLPSSPKAAALRQTAAVLRQAMRADEVADRALREIEVAAGRIEADDAKNARSLTISPTVSGEMRDHLVRGGFLDPERRENQQAVREAFKSAIAFGLDPPAAREPPPPPMSVADCAISALVCEAAQRRVLK